MAYKDDKLKTAHRREMRIIKNKQHGSMACGAKKPSEDARKWFKRPAYSRFESEKED